MKSGFLRAGRSLCRVLGGCGGNGRRATRCRGRRPVDLVLAALDDHHVLDGLLLAVAAVGESLIDGGA